MSVPTAVTGGLFYSQIAAGDAFTVGLLGSAKPPPPSPPPPRQAQCICAEGLHSPLGCVLVGLRALTASLLFSALQPTITTVTSAATATSTTAPTLTPTSKAGLMQLCWRS